ncbi:MAG: glycerate kinase [Lentisphaerae bacterium]|nr:glycerate kinase [Lentisphaerota bacterium]
MTIAIAPDSFKGTLTAPQAAACMARGLVRAIPKVRTRLIPMADGGEGTVAAVVGATGGRLVRRRVRDPLGRPVRATFGLSGDGRTAVIEMSEASGLVRLAPGERNPLMTSTAGTGDLIRAALDLGARHLLIGIGGSATNDGGTGMARALGVRFVDRAGRELREGGGALGRLARIDMSGCDARLLKARIRVACDVDNPLCGREGASRVYGPQKGGTPAMVATLDANLRRLAAIVRRDLGVEMLHVPGGGAAGGLGAGLMAFAGGTLRKGVEIVIDCVGLAKRLDGCDVVITGEGRMDGQTARGKTPAGVARVAKQLGLPVIAICGMLGPGVEAVRKAGIDAWFSTVVGPLDDKDVKATAARRLTDAAEQVGRVLAARLSGGGRGGRARSDGRL